MRSSPTFRPKSKECGFKAALARWLVNMARRVSPESEEVGAFYLQMLHDYAICGHFITRVDPTKCLYLEDKITVSNGETAEFQRVS